MARREEIEAEFPEIADIEDDAIASAVVDAWEIALEENEPIELGSVLWFGPFQGALGLSDEFLVDHVRDVVTGSVALAEALIARRDTDIDLDVVIAGALVHDISHVAEFDGTEWSAVGELLGHPHYGVYVVRRAGLPIEVEHIVLSHPPSTSTDPATMEAEVVSHVDATVASSIKARSFDNLLDAPTAGRYG